MQRRRHALPHALKDAGYVAARSGARYVLPRPCVFSCVSPRIAPLRARSAAPARSSITTAARSADARRYRARYPGRRPAQDRPRYTWGTSAPAPAPRWGVPTPPLRVSAGRAASPAPTALETQRSAGTRTCAGIRNFDRYLCLSSRVRLAAGLGDRLVLVLIVPLHPVHRFAIRSTPSATGIAISPLSALYFVRPLMFRSRRIPPHGSSSGSQWPARGHSPQDLPAWTSVILSLLRRAFGRLLVDWL